MMREAGACCAVYLIPHLELGGGGCEFAEALERFRDRR